MRRRSLLMIMNPWSPGHSVAQQAVVDNGSPLLAFHPPGGGLLAWPHTPRRRSVVILAVVHGARGRDLGLSI